MPNNNMKTVMQVFREYGVSDVQFIAGKNQKQCIRIMYNGKSISTSAWTRKNAEEFAKTCQNCESVSDAISLNSYEDEEGQEYSNAIHKIRYMYPLVYYDTIIDFILTDFAEKFSIKKQIKMLTECKMEDGMTREDAHKTAMQVIRNNIKNNELALYKGNTYSYITISYIYAAWEIEQGNRKPNQETAEAEAKKIVYEINKLQIK